MEKKEKKSKERDNVIKFAEFVRSMDEGDSSAPTTLFRSAKIHPDQGGKLLDIYDTLRELGIKTIRNIDGRVREVIKSNEELALKKEVREIRKGLDDVKNILDEINLKLRQKPKKK